MKNVDWIRLVGSAALFCVALALGGVWFELHQMRSTWNPMVRVSTARTFGPAFEVEIKKPVEVKK